MHVRAVVVVDSDFSGGFIKRNREVILMIDSWVLNLNG